MIYIDSAPTTPGSMFRGQGTIRREIATCLDNIIHLQELGAPHKLTVYWRAQVLLLDCELDILRRGTKAAIGA